MQSTNVDFICCSDRTDDEISAHVYQGQEKSTSTYGKTATAWNSKSSQFNRRKWPNHLRFSRYLGNGTK